jgi:hypothetical protein
MSEELSRATRWAEDVNVCEGGVYYLPWSVVRSCWFVVRAGTLEALAGAKARVELAPTNRLSTCTSRYSLLSRLQLCEVNANVT